MTDLEFGAVYELSAPDFLLSPTGILDGRGRMIYSKPVIGFHGPIREYVVDTKEEERED